MGVATQLYEEKTWASLVEDAGTLAGADFLVPFSDLAWLIAAYVAVTPYRAWTDVVMWLDHAFKPKAAKAP